MLFSGVKYISPKQKDGEAQRQSEERLPARLPFRVIDSQVHRILRMICYYHLNLRTEPRFSGNLAPRVGLEFRPGFGRSLAYG